MEHGISNLLILMRFFLVVFFVSSPPLFLFPLFLQGEFFSRGVSQSRPSGEVARGAQHVGAAEKFKLNF